LDNFELKLAGQSSVLLIGNNGSGKTTVALALEVFQRIARGVSRVNDLVKPKDILRQFTEIPVRFELEVDLKGKTYEYVIALELPRGFKELRVLEEKLTVDGRPIYSRAQAQVYWANRNKTGSFLKDAADQKASEFQIDWHVVYLPIVQVRSEKDPVFGFKQWLQRMLILRPVPNLIGGESNGETLDPNPQLTNFGAWFKGLLTRAPAAYRRIDEFLKLVMGDLNDIQNEELGKDARSLIVQFSNGQDTIRLPFSHLSDGEKCFMICGMVLAANESYGPLVCFWDEPDNYLALSEVGHFVMALRKGFQSGGQFIATSHNPEAIRVFSDENTLLLHRKSHLEPTVVRPLNELPVKGDLIGALVRGDVDA